MENTMKKIKMLIALSALVLIMSAASQARTSGAVYAMTNALGQNQVLVYHRASNGTLKLVQTIATGGGGSGVQLAGIDSLGSQGALALDKGHHRLFAVNTETLASNGYDCQEGTITSFLVRDNGRLTFADRVASGGLYPNSLTISYDLLYVLNAGGPGLTPACIGTSPNISGFKADVHGKIKPLANSRQPIDPGPLDGTGSFLNCDPGGFSPAALFYCGLNPPAFPRSAAKVGFTPAGNQLVVTVKGTNTIYVFGVGRDGRAGTPTLTQAPGPSQPTYFGFTFDKAGHMIVTEPFGTSPTIPNGTASSVSSFAISPTGTLQAISTDIANGQALSCWVALDPTGQYAYVSDNGNGKISTYSVGSDGSLTLLTAISAVATNPNDLAIAHNGATSYLYSLDAGDGTVGAFQINLDGSLTSLGTVGGLPVNSGAQGLAAY
jgi:6-phosphogluconolactonase